MKHIPQLIISACLLAVLAACPPSASALVFKGIQPGISDKGVVDRILGTGKPQDTSSKHPWFEYALDPYANVHVQYVDNIAQIIHVNFKNMIPMPQVLETLGVTDAPESTEQLKDGELKDLFPRQGLVVGYKTAGKHKLVQWVNFKEPKYLKIENLWLEFDKEHPDYFGSGIILHVDFEAVGLMNEPVALDSWYHLQDPDRGLPALPCKSPAYSDGRDNVWCGKSFTPRRRVVQYRDFQLFMPYNQLFLPAGKSHVTVDLWLRAKDAAHDRVKKEFNLDLKAAANEVTILSTRVEHNVTVDDFKGMRVHVHFKIGNHKDQKCRAILFVNAKRGLFPIKGYDWINTEGEVMSRCYFTPPYQDSEYKDFQLFLPYREIRKPVSGEAEMVGRVVIRDQTDRVMTETYFYFTIY